MEQLDQVANELTAEAKKNKSIYSVEEQAELIELDENWQVVKDINEKIYLCANFDRKVEYVVIIHSKNDIIFHLAHLNDQNRPIRKDTFHISREKGHFNMDYLEPLLADGEHGQELLNPEQLEQVKQEVLVGLNSLHRALQAQESSQPE